MRKGQGGGSWGRRLHTGPGGRVVLSRVGGPHTHCTHHSWLGRNLGAQRDFVNVPSFTSVGVHCAPLVSGYKVNKSTLHRTANEPTIAQVISHLGAQRALGARKGSRESND